MNVVIGKSGTVALARAVRRRREVQSHEAAVRADDRLHGDADAAGGAGAGAVRVEAVADRERLVHRQIHELPVGAVDLQRGGEVGEVADEDG